MADQLQLRGGTTSEHSTFTGALREVTVDTDKDVLVVHDNSTAGGHPLMAEDGSNSALALGSAGTPSLKFTGDTNTGVFSPAADTVGVSTGGTERARIDSSGRLLVGLTSTSARVNTIFQGTSGGVAVSEVLLARDEATPPDGNTLGDIQFSDNTHTDSASIRAQRDGGTWSASSKPTRLVFTTCEDGAASPTERMRITKAGNVGIGTTSPINTLHVSGTNQLMCEDSATSNYFQFRTTGGEGVINAYLSTTAAMPIVFKQYGTERARIDSSGRLLVGVSSTTTVGTMVLAGRSDSANSGAILRLAKNGAAPNNGETLGIVAFSDSGHNTAGSVYGQRDGGTWTSGSSHPTRLGFTTTPDGSATPVERMRISRGGMISTSPDTGWDGIRVSSKTGASTVRTLFAGDHSATGLNTGTACYRVWTNGNVENTNNSYGAISDAKLKENIVDASSQWNDLKAIQIRNYNFKEGQTHTQIGVVAQEVELVSPGLVSESPDTDAEGNDLGTTTKSVNYSVLYMKAVKALQEAMERIETLEAKVSALEAS